MIAAQMGYEPGDVVSKRYRILTKLGEGAFGVVFRARDLETREEVALKFLRSGLGLDAEQNRRIEREAIAMARLSGTCAVYVHGLRLADDGMSYLVMEMLHGMDFERFMGEAERRGGRVSRNKLAELMRPVVDTLEAAHARGIIHRDLKPSNVFVIDARAGGGVRLLDFGLVKLLDAGALTADGTVAGSPSYIAPEIWEGNPRALDHRIDVYSLGVLLFRALSGQLPMGNLGMMQLYEWVKRGERPSLRRFRPELPEAVDEWVQRALHPDRDRRYGSVRELWSALEPLLIKPRSDPF